MTYSAEQAWTIALSFGAVCGIVIWQLARIPQRISEEAAETRKAIEYLRHTLIDRTPQEKPFPGNQEIIDAIGEVEQRVSDIAIGLEGWRKETTPKPVSPAPTSKYDLD